jgi:hypothetical protein
VLWVRCFTEIKIDGLLVLLLILTIL